MNIKHKKELLMSLVLLGATSCSANVFASNPYGIEYAGGEPLGEENVQIMPDLINQMSPIIQKDDDVDIVFSDSDLWQDGYAKASANYCGKMKYVRLYEDTTIDRASGLSYRVSNQNYSVDISIDNVVKDNIEFTDANDGSIMIGVAVNNDMSYYGIFKGAILGGYTVYNDEACQEKAFTNTRYLAPKIGHVYVETTQKLFKNNNLKNVYAYDGLYYGITDIDNAQSYKVLNTNNMLVEDNMYAKSAASLQKSGSGVLYKNMYNADEKYIYSEHGVEVGDKINLSEDADIFMRLLLNTQQNGLNMVYGFAAPAGSNVAYYTKQFTVSYRAEGGGKITGIESERIIPGDSPVGSEAQPDKGYKFIKWVPNVDVTLQDGKTIKAGSPITEEEIKKVVVDGDIIFTALFEEEVLAPDTGSFTKNTDAATVVATSIIGILLLALSVRYLPHIARKKIHFE